MELFLRIMTTLDSCQTKNDKPLAHEALKVNRVSWKGALWLLSGGVFLDFIGFYALCAYPYAFNALGTVYPNLLEIWKPDFFGLVLRMGNIMPCLGTFSTYITPS